MSQDILVYSLAIVTLLLVVLFGIQQVRRMRRIRGRTKPSALADDGNPHDKQP
jgi:hypothetical protein